MGRRFLSVAYYESQSEPATSSPRAQPPPAALSSSPPPSPPAPTRRAPRRVSSSARTLDPELAAIRAETSAALESVSNRLQNLRALLIAASSLNMNAQPAAGAQPDDDNGGGDRGPDVGPGHSAIVITPGSDAAVQTSQPPPPSSVTFSQAADDPRTSLARRLQEGPPSSSQQPVAQRLVEAVREIRATIDRAPGLAERLGRIAAATAPETASASASTGATLASTMAERRRTSASVAAPILVEFQQRRAARESRVARASASEPTDVGTAPSDQPALVPATMRRVRYNADGEEIPVQQSMPRALDGRPLFHVMGGRPRPIPRRASAETVIVPESPRDSDGEGEVLAMESPYWTPPSPGASIRRNQLPAPPLARMFPPADSSGTAQGSSSRRNVPNAGSLTYNRWRDALILNEHPVDFLAPEDSPTRDISRQHRALRLDVESTPPAITPAAGITDSAWRTRMEFLTSTVNLPLGDNANNERTRSTSPVRQEASFVLKASVVPREEPPALIPCPLPQPVEDMMASDDEDGNGSLQPGVLYW